MKKLRLEFLGMAMLFWLGVPVLAQAPSLSPHGTLEHFHK